MTHLGALQRVAGRELEKGRKGHEEESRCEAQKTPSTMGEAQRGQGRPPACSEKRLKWRREEGMVAMATGRGRITGSPTRELGRRRGVEG